MEISIKNSSKKACVSFDHGGNIYLNTLDNLEKIYDINIDSRNMLTCDRYEILDKGADTHIIYPNQHGKMDLTNHEKSLKGKLLSEYDKELQERKENNSDEDNDEDTDIKQQELVDKYYPENRQYFYDDGDEYQDGDDEYFKFLKYDTDMEIVDREVSNALYDTLIYNDNGSLSFKTELIGCNPIYRICIYKSGYIKFRPIGLKETIYNIEIDNDTIIFTK
jgi:hypothetical protein